MLATLPDYEARYGNVDDSGQVETRLADAASLVRRVAKLTISTATTDETREGDGSTLLQLDELPIVAVAAVLEDGVALAPPAWRILDGGRTGQLRREHGRWPCERPITVSYTHGWDPVPADIIGLVCSMVHRAARPEALEGIQQQTTGAQSVSYAVTSAGATIWLTQAEAGRLTDMSGPAVA